MPKIFTGKLLVGGLLPFIPALIGVALKFTFIDSYDPQTSKIPTFLFDTYLKSCWIDFIVVAYVSGFAALMSSPQNRSNTDLWIYLGFPAVCFLLCILFVIATPKLGFRSDLLEVYIPTLITGFSLATTGARNVR